MWTGYRQSSLSYFGKPNFDNLWAAVGGHDRVGLWEFSILVGTLKCQLTKSFYDCILKTFYLVDLEKTSNIDQQLQMASHISGYCSRHKESRNPSASCTGCFVTDFEILNYRRKDGVALQCPIHCKSYIIKWRNFCSLFWIFIEKYSHVNKEQSLLWHGTLVVISAIRKTFQRSRWGRDESFLLAANIS